MRPLLIRVFVLCALASGCASSEVSSTVVPSTETEPELEIQTEPEISTTATTAAVPAETAGAPEVLATIDNPTRMVEFAPPADSVLPNDIVSSAGDCGFWAIIGSLSTSEPVWRADTSERHFSPDDFSLLVHDAGDSESADAVVAKLRTIQVKCDEDSLNDELSVVLVPIDTPDEESVGFGYWFNVDTNPNTITVQSEGRFILVVQRTPLSLAADFVDELLTTAAGDWVYLDAMAGLPFVSGSGVTSAPLPDPTEHLFTRGEPLVLDNFLPAGLPGYPGITGEVGPGYELTDFSLGESQCESIVAFNTLDEELSRGIAFTDDTTFLVEFAVGHTVKKDVALLVGQTLASCSDDTTDQLVFKFTDLIDLGRDESGVFFEASVEPELSVARVVVVVSKELGLYAVADLALPEAEITWEDIEPYFDQLVDEIEPGISFLHDCSRFNQLIAVDELVALYMLKHSEVGIGVCSGSRDLVGFSGN